MTWIDDIKPTYATVTGRFVSIDYDSVDEDLTPDVQPLNGKITFTPTTTDGRISSAYAWIKPVKAQIFGGELLAASGDALRILATDAPIGVKEWAWRAEVTLSEGPRINPFTFLAPAGTTVDLTGTSLIPVTSNPVTVLQGIQCASIEDVEVGEGEHAGQIRFSLTDGTHTRWMAVPNGPGTTPQITATAHTLAPGAPATVAVDGPPEAPVLTFGIPRGRDGASITAVTQPSPSSMDVTVTDPVTGPTTTTLTLPDTRTTFTEVAPYIWQPST